MYASDRVPAVGRLAAAPHLALSRGHRWLAMVESGKFKSPKEIPKREGFETSYVSGTIKLTTLASGIVAALLEQTLPLEARCLTGPSTGRALWKSSSPHLREPRD